MIIDATKTELFPGNHGNNCKGNGTQTDRFGQLIECCCDECDYFLCCFESQSEKECKNCWDLNCPRANKTETIFNEASPFK